MSESHIEEVVNYFISRELTVSDFIRRYLDSNAEVKPTKEEFVEICYQIDKHYDDYMVANNEVNGINMSGYITEKYTYEEYINDFNHMLTL